MNTSSRCQGIILSTTYREVEHIYYFLIAVQDLCAVLFALSMEKVTQKESATVTHCETLMGMDPSWWLVLELADTDRPKKSPKTVLRILKTELELTLVKRLQLSSCFCLQTEGMLKLSVPVNLFLNCSIPRNTNSASSLHLEPIAWV